MATNKTPTFTSTIFDHAYKYIFRHSWETHECGIFIYRYESSYDGMIIKRIVFSNDSSFNIHERYAMTYRNINDPKDINKFLEHVKNATIIKEIPLREFYKKEKWIITEIWSLIEHQFHTWWKKNVNNFEASSYFYK